MFRNLLNPNSPLMIVMRQFTDFIFLSLFWLLLCFPVVTIGPASAALYDSVVRTFRRGEAKPWHRFWHSFKQNLKVGVIGSVVYLAAVLGLGWCLIRLWNGAVYGQVAWPVFSGVCFGAFVLLGVLSLMFPLLSRFETTAVQLLGNTVRLALGNLPRTLGLAAVSAAGAFLCIRYIWPLFIVPCCAAYLASFLVEPILKPYMPQKEEAAAIEE